MMNRFLLIILSVLTLFRLSAQCEVKNRIGADQTMYYYIKSELFYYTEAKSLKGNITTDKQNYFLRLSPKPFPDKDEKKKLDRSIHIVLTNDSAIVLENFDVEYRARDTSVSLMYQIPNELLSAFMVHDIKSLTMDLGDESGERHYVFVLHKATLREQLNCLKELK